MKAIVLFLTMILGWAGTAVAAGTAGPRCTSCAVALTESYKLFSNPMIPQPVPLCTPCSKLKVVCATCNLPLKTNGTKLVDGRLLCGPHFKTALFDVHEAERIFEQSKRDVMRLYQGHGVLPDRNISVALVNGVELAGKRRQEDSHAEEMRTLGLTHTRSPGPGQFEHQVYLIDGLTRSRTAAVAVHEYAHAWLHENVPSSRKMDADTIEAFCELTAFKVMQERGEAIEQTIIRSNTYTHGQILAFIRAESEVRFPRMIEWIMNGADASLKLADTARVLTVNARPGPVPPHLMGTALTPVPDELVLKGISRVRERAYALINDRTLEVNEEARVRVGETNVLVRCVRIGDRAVSVRINNAPEPVELHLRAH